MVALQNDDYWYFLAVGRDHRRRVIRLRRRAGGRDPMAGTILASQPLPGSGPVELRVAMHGASYDFSWSENGKHWRSLKRGADGTILSTKRSGGFVGAVFGLYAHGAPAKPAIAFDHRRSSGPRVLSAGRQTRLGQCPDGCGAEGGGACRPPASSTRVNDGRQGRSVIAGLAQGRLRDRQPRLVASAP